MPTTPQKPDAGAAFNQAMQSVQRRTHAATVIASAAIMDALLERCLKAAMRPLPKKIYADLFDPMRPLGSLSGKITMAYALQIVEKDAFAKFELMRRIRNVFAHSSESLHLESPEVSSLFGQLKQSVHIHSKNPDSQYMECLLPLNLILENYLAAVASPLTS